uniref:Uncharacterized protein n=1 Tax=viral metagenome TaxID=1070528 RepID=A0A6M3IVD2_9ZZZZ
MRKGDKVPWTYCPLCGEVLRYGVLRGAPVHYCAGSDGTLRPETSHTVNIGVGEIAPERPQVERGGPGVKSAPADKEE